MNTSLYALRRLLPPKLCSNGVFFSLTIMVSLLFTTTTFALPEDSQQPIYIASDSAVKDDIKGVTIYQGDVEMSQGTMNIRADKVTIYTEAEKVSKIVAIGKPATFKQQPEIDRGDVLAEGETIEYEVNNKVIVLTDKASLTQDDGSSIKGNRIEYDVNASRAQASSGGNNERVNVVIPPNQAPNETP